MKKAIKQLIQRRLEDSVRRLFEQQHPVVVAVTGSVGKTSTKEAIVAVLKTKYKVRSSKPGYNAELSLPLGIFGLSTPSPLWNAADWYKVFREIKHQTNVYPFDVVVLEMGADAPGDIKAFLEYISPDMGVITAVGPTHLELFGTVDNVFQEKWRLAAGSKQVIYNADDKLLNEAAAKLQRKRATGYGLTQGEVRATAVAAGAAGLSMQLSVGGRKKTIQTKMIAPHSLYSLLAAAAVGHRLGMSMTQIGSALGAIEPERGRMRPIPGRKGSLIIDDSYNASPDSVSAALDQLASLKDRRRIAVLGNMNELGGFMKEAHRMVGTKAARSADIVVTIGANAREYIAGEALKRGKDPASVASFNDPFQAGEYVAGILKNGDVILVKGSQNGVFSEEAIKPLMQRPQSAEKLLVRQSSEWLRKKKKSFADSN